MSMLQDHNLVLVVVEGDLVMEDWIEHRSWLPVSVVLTPLLLVGLLSGWFGLCEGLWSYSVWIESLASCNNSVAQV